MVYGGPEALEVVELPEVHAGPGQVHVRIHAAAVNPTDTLARNGSRAEQQKADPPPYVPGMDAAGIVDEVGDAVSTGVQVGDAVMAMVVWRHVGYVMILYLAGLKSVDPALKEAAAIDGATERQAFFRVVFPTLRPVNIIVLVITVIEALRAFDIVYAINNGRNGLELISVLVTQNIVGEASRIGFGSALAVILLATSLGFVIVYLNQIIREERR